MEEEYFINWLNNDTYFKSLATIKLYAERTNDTDIQLTNDYLTYLAVRFCAEEIVRQGKGESITDVAVAKSMIFDEDDCE